MFLPRNDRLLLHKLKSVQGEEYNYIVIDLDQKITCRCFGQQQKDVEKAYASDLWEKLPKNKLATSSSLDYLISIGMVKKVNSGPVYKVTPQGWRNSSVREHEIVVAVITHVLFPSLVAFVTTLLTLTIRGI